MTYKDKLYYYKGTITNIVDGDSIDVLISLGLTSSRLERLQLARISAPHPYGESTKEGKAAKEYLESQAPVGSEVIIRTEKSDAFGRYIAELYRLDMTNLNDEMVKAGHAEYRHY